MIVVSPEWRQRAFISDFIYARGILPRHQPLVGGRSVLLRSQLQEVTAVHQLVDHLVQVPVEFLTKDLLCSFLLLPYGTVYVCMCVCMFQLYIVYTSLVNCTCAEQEYCNNVSLGMRVY